MACIQHSLLSLKTSALSALTTSPPSRSRFVRCFFSQQHHFYKMFKTTAPRRTFKTVARGQRIVRRCEPTKQSSAADATAGPSDDGTVFHGGNTYSAAEVCIETSLCGKAFIRGAPCVGISLAPVYRAMIQAMMSRVQTSVRMRGLRASRVTMLVPQ